MYRNDNDSLWEKYESIFDSVEKKASAFDQIARNFYIGNFGSLQKSDIEVLMFSLLLDEILNKSENDINTYSDYTLAKQLGVTPNKINNLKLKKQLQYPYESFKWEISFQRCCQNARLDGGKIKINLRDVNLYYELKNQVEIMGGFAETSLTRNLLVISPEDFFRLTEELMTEEERTNLEKAIRMANSSNKEFLADLEKESLPSAMKRQFGSEIIDVLFDVVKGLSPGIVGSGISLLKTVVLAAVNNR